MTLSTNHIRQAFLDFFARNGHEVMPSSPLVPQNDPTLMFTNAGMVQFKDIFTGREKPKASRAATSQKCVRAGGKHNDLENVGYTARHHTFFEMLGNFSFGDYFKERAIELAWKLLVEEYKLPKDKLTITVYHTDDDAFNLWKKISGFPDSKIIRIPTSDNFWAMGDTGPCGPCSEIFYDHGEKIFGGPPGSKDADGDRFVEIWNLVFMQYEQVDANTRNNLPKPSIDTGMGLERISAVLQGVHDNYDIDLFRNLIKASEDLTKTKAEGEHKASHRVIADHLRASSFLIADGVLPSNEGRGYVLRRIMRRAMRHIHMLGAKDAVMYRLVPTLVNEMGKAYPELKRAEKVITENLRAEEERFKQTLERGLKLLEEESADLKKGGQLSGEVAFKLYDTYGFPLDLTQDILRARGISVDDAGFEKAMEKQKDMARAAWSGSGEKATSGNWFLLRNEVGPTEFTGYSETHTAHVEIKAIVVGDDFVRNIKQGEKAAVIFNKTPFYGESGGQVGDTGWIKHGEKIVAEILDTQKPFQDFHVHYIFVKEGELKVGDFVDLQIDSARRDRIRANHSATHILHAVLRKQLGEHITQKGSLVAPDKLRFDISHNKAISREELEKIEREVNRIIWQNSDTCTEILTPAEAQKKGAMALFGEKYGDSVRVLSMGIDSLHPIPLPQTGEGSAGNARAGEGKPYSMELCGGTHVRRTGDIGLFKITGESAIAAGVRRIEAVTGPDAFAYLLEQEARLREMAELLKTPVAELPKRVEGLVNERRKLEKELSEAKKAAALGGGSSEAKKETIGNIGFIAKVFDSLDPKELRGIADSYRPQADVIALGTSVEGKGSVLVAVNQPLAQQRSAVTLVQAAVAELGGKGGGGRPEMAQGGGPDGSKLNEAMEAIRKSLKAG